MMGGLDQGGSGPRDSLRERLVEELGQNNAIIQEVLADASTDAEAQAMLDQLDLGDLDEDSTQDARNAREALRDRSIRQAASDLTQPGSMTGDD
jgi:hypothetical protein